MHMMFQGVLQPFKLCAGLGGPAWFSRTVLVNGEKSNKGKEINGPMTIRRGVMGSTSGIPIPITVMINDERIMLRKFVIRNALAAENRDLSQGEKDRILKITRGLRTEFPDCWKHHHQDQKCHGIRRAARILINLLVRHPSRSRKKEIKDLKRWIEYGKRL